jgi:hypothetical protein
MRSFEVRRIEVADLERVLVALDCSFGTGDLLSKRGTLFGQRSAVGLLARGGLLDRVTDEAAVAVDPGELGEDRGLQLLAG